MMPKRLDTKGKDALKESGARAERLVSALAERLPHLMKVTKALSGYRE